MSALDSSLAAFAAEGFDPVEFVNSACAAAPAEEPLEKYLNELEMKLQLMAEDVVASLDELSVSTLQRAPRATREIVRVKEHAGALRGGLEEIRGRLSESEKASANSVKVLGEIDLVKQRMEASRGTLQEAAGLAELLASVDQVFATGNLSKIAETLASMRRCLAVVGNVPEFAGGKQKLVVLEDRLESMVLPQLTDALKARNIDKTQTLRDILGQVDRTSCLETQYTRSQIPRMQAFLGTYDSKTQTFAEWLPNFYDELLTIVEEESKWCMEAFSEVECKTLVPRMLFETLCAAFSTINSRVESSCLALLNMPDESSSGEPRALALLISLHSQAVSFSRNVAHLLSFAHDEEMVMVMGAIFQPFEGRKRTYGDLEARCLGEQLDGVDLAETMEFIDSVAKMESSVLLVISFMEEAVQRCMAFTGGSEAESLLKALDDCGLKYLTTMTELLRALRGACPLVATDAEEVDISEDEAEKYRESYIQGSLQLLSVSMTVTARTNSFEASLRRKLEELEPFFSGPIQDGLVAVPGQALDPALVRITDSSNKAKAKKLSALLEQAQQDVRFNTLPLMSQKAANFEGAVQQLVYDVLISKVRSCLHGVKSLPIWSAQSDQEGDSADIPVFSAYPQPFVTSLGEYLLTLPQTLEPLMGLGPLGMAGDSTDDTFYASEWVLKIANGAASLVTESLLGIEQLSDGGAQQLAADLEYIINVLSALSVTIDPKLATLQLVVATPADQLSSQLTNAAEGAVDMKTVDLVSRMRNMSLTSGSASDTATATTPETTASVG